MTSKWWNGVKTDGEPPDQGVTWTRNGATVHHMPRPTLDDLEREVAKRQNAVIDGSAAVDRAILAYNDSIRALEEARSRLAERLKESGARVEFAVQYEAIPIKREDT